MVVGSQTHGYEIQRMWMAGGDAGGQTETREWGQNEARGCAHVTNEVGCGTEAGRTCRVSQGEVCATKELTTIAPHGKIGECEFQRWYMAQGDAGGADWVARTGSKRGLGRTESGKRSGLGRRLGERLSSPQEILTWDGGWKDDQAADPKTVGYYIQIAVR